MRTASPRPALPKYDFRGRLIALAGIGRSGKNTAADLMCKHLGPRAAQMAFAASIKQIVQGIYAFSDEQVYGDLKNEPDLRYPRAHDWQRELPSDNLECTRCGVAIVSLSQSEADAPCSCLTPRETFLAFGTAAGRACWADTWVHLTMRAAHDKLTRTRVLPRPGGNGGAILERTDLILVTDCRCINEAEAVVRAGGEVWLIEREAAGLGALAAGHVTETESQSETFRSLVTEFVDNNSTLEALEAHLVYLLQARGLCRVS